MSELGLLGLLLRPGDAGYTWVRANWNGTVDQHPSLSARTEGTADVIASARLAREQGLPPVAVKATGAGKAKAGDSKPVNPAKDWPLERPQRTGSDQDFAATRRMRK